MAKITYNNKTALITNPDIADENKITDNDMNEIKEVVNENDDKFLTNGLNVSNEVDEDYRVNLLYSKNVLNFSRENEYSVKVLSPDITTTYDTFNNKVIYTVNSLPQAGSQAGYYYEFNTEIGKTYKVKSKWLNTSGGTISNVRICSDTSGTTIINNMTSDTEYSFTATKETYYFRVWITNSIGSGYVQNAIVSSGNTTTYEPYTQNQIVVDNEKYSDTLNVGNVVDSRSRVNVLHSKNLLPNNGSTITTNGITFTKNSDGSLTINGTASGGRADYYLFGGSSDNGNYLKIKKGTYSFNRSNLTDGTMFVAFREKTAGSKYETTTNNSAIETMASQDCYFYGVMIGVENGKTINNLTIYPMLNEGSTLLDYEPYIVPSIYVDNEEIYSKDNIDIYSTNEIRIGTWIDGKPIYRTVYEKNNTTAGNISYTIAPPSNLRVITKLDIMQYTANEGSYIHDYYNSSSDYLRIFYFGQLIQVRTSKTSSYNHYITIEYTKTTD